MRDIVNRNLIIDVGMCEGNDTEFYLRKGFNVVGIEADTSLCQQMELRFQQEIRAGKLLILNRAGYRTTGSQMEFSISSVSLGHSKLKSGVDAGASRIEIVESISWPGIVKVSGVPYYCKIDIEGAETPLLESMTDTKTLPEYISVEAHDFSPIEMLNKIGYSEFKLIHQNNHNAFQPPNPPQEGNYLPGYNFVHASGYFGRELYGNTWLNFREIAAAYEAIRLVKHYGALPHIWFDCHAHYAE